ncbi:ABC transporter ATP-binding protein [Luedemannella helvata]|uniref:ABC transporter ATP-binding protein n=1 Tax=Luedemannella helvata TaxID=349315 RepID=A0ABN2KU76_9ACTN
MSTVVLRQLTKTYPTGVTAVDHVDLTVADGEVMVLLGPTGCGKSTVLRLIAGLDPATSGHIEFGGAGVDDVPARDREVAMVFQDYGLYPHLTVAENIAFPLLNHHVEEAERDQRVREVADLLDLSDVLDKRPGRLSGGQRQRVAMARAIVRHPRVFLLDEPLSNLDAAVRESVRNHLADLIHRLDVATIYVTHDQTEAMCLGDRVAVMRQGRIEQIGTPEEIYSDPQCLFVAAFVGSPRMNLLQAAVHIEPGRRAVVDLGAQTLSLPWSNARARALATHHGARVTVGFRPDALVPTGDADGADLHGVVRLVEHRGHDALVHLETGSVPTPHLISQLELPDAHGELAHILGEEPPVAHPLRRRLARIVPQPRRADEPGRYALQPTYSPEAEPAREALGDVTARVPAASAPRVGETVSLRLDVDHLYLFDRAGDRIALPATSVALREAV